MWMRQAALVIVALTVFSSAHAQQQLTIDGESTDWKSANGANTAGIVTEPAANESSGVVFAGGEQDANARVPITLVSNGSGELPNEAGQVWREYDIRPYTAKVTGTERPQQAVIDWILRETGTEVWFTEPFGILNATRDTLRVYHTPEMQSLVLDIVDRFVKSQAEPQALSLRLVTVSSPNWRSTALPLLQPIDVRATGVDAWLLSKENAALLVGQLRKRADFREHNSPNLVIHNGQSQSISRLTPKNYVRTVRMKPNVWPGHELMMGQLQEGFSLQLSPLMSLDGDTIDAVVQCNVDQIEKLVPVSVDVPTVGGGAQRVQIQVPQIVSWRLHERFRWPANKVLLLSVGVVAAPTPEKVNALGIPIPLPSLSMSPGRADALLFVENKGKASQTLMQAQRNSRDGNPSYNGRY